MIPVSEFAANMMRHQGVPAALIIGLDGGASLLNHDRPLKILDDLLGDSPAISGSSFNQHYIAPAWRNLTLEKRQQFMACHTVPADASKPDERAIDCIANMINDGHVRAIVSTDSGHVLFEELRTRGIKMNWINGAGSYSNTLKARKDEPTFVDGGDLLLNGLWPNMYDISARDIQEMQSGLRDFLKPYEYIYCWGWCEFNVQISQVCPERGAPAFTALGRYTSRYITFPFEEINIVSCRSDSETDASNGILHELADILFRNKSVANAARPASIARRELAEPPAQELPHVLLTEAAKSELAEQVGRAAVSFIGVEGELARERCADWLAAFWRAQGRQSLAYTSDDVHSLVCWVAFTDDTRDPAWLVGRLVGDVANRPDWASVLVLHVRRWLDTSRPDAGDQAAMDRHVVLFVPPTVAQWAARAFEQRDTLWAQSYFEATFLAEGVVVEWLIKNVGPLLRSGLNHGALPLARQIVGSGHHPGQADWLHGALDAWYRDILREEGRRAEAAIDDSNGADVPELGLGDLFGLWDQLCDRCERADEVTRVDLDVDLRQSQEQDDGGAPAGDLPDFTIEVTPRSVNGPREQSDAASPAEPAGPASDAEPAGPASDAEPAGPASDAEPREGEGA